MKKMSYWIDTAPAPSYPEFEGDRKCDIAVIGAGLTGITTALLLAKTGADVVVLEAGRVGSGTSGHSTAKVTAQHGLKLQTLSEKRAVAYAKVNEAGLKKITALVDEYKIDCDFERVSAYVYTRDENDISLIEKEMRVYEHLGISGRVVENTPLPFEVKSAIEMDGQAQFHPVKYLHALADILIKNGGSIYERSKALDFERKENCVIRTEKGRLFARTAVFATNYPLIDFPGLFFLKLHQERSYIISTKAGGVDVSGMYINIREPVNSIRMQHSKGVNQLLLVGYGHKTADEDSGESSYERLRGFLHSDFKDADETPLYEWSAQDSVTLDALPYVGAIYNKPPDVYVATGFAKWGITNSAAAAMMLSDDVAGTSFIDRQMREQFDPIRFTPGASAKNFFVQAGDIFKAFTAGNALIPTGEYNDIKEGKGAVMRIEGKAQAVYKDMDGNMSAFKAHCTHMGCPLEYNEADKSFDCPCHGSRFSMNGEILNGPAKETLKKAEEIIEAND